VRVRFALPVRLAVATAVLGACATAPVALASPHAVGAHHAAVRIWPLGDSITWGWDPVSSDPYVPVQLSPGGYRSYLDQALRAGGVPHRFVGTTGQNATVMLNKEGEALHDGHNGYRIDQIAADLDGLAGGDSDNHGRWLTGYGKRRVVPDVIVIHLGSNDIGQGWDPAHRYPTSNGLANLRDSKQRAQFVWDMGKRLQSLVDKIYRLSPHARIVLSDIVPINYSAWARTARDYSTIVHQVEARERHAGHRIVFVDVWHRFAHVVRRRIVNTPGMLSPDNVHPTALGYAAMARLYYAAIRQVMAL
jgi:lysophospholipase L1-like esterase